MFNIDFRVERSINISKDFETVKKTILDFNTWPTWSPWLTQEPDAIHMVSGEAGIIGHRQEWDGEQIGKGSMTLKKLQDHHHIEYELEIIKPWKSKSVVKFSLIDQKQSVEVVWSMLGKLPIFMFFIKKSMQEQIAGDYDRGLNLLKSLLETGDASSTPKSANES